MQSSFLFYTKSPFPEDAGPRDASRIDREVDPFVFRPGSYADTPETPRVRDLVVEDHAPLKIVTQEPVVNHYVVATAGDMDRSV